jgi:hypothetical protein
LENDGNVNWKSQQEPVAAVSDRRNHLQNEQPAVGGRRYSRRPFLALTRRGALKKT